MPSAGGAHPFAYGAFTDPDCGRPRCAWPGERVQHPVIAAVLQEAVDRAQPVGAAVVARAVEPSAPALDRLGIRECRIIAPAERPQRCDAACALYMRKTSP